MTTSSKKRETNSYPKYHATSSVHNDLMKQALLPPAYFSAQQAQYYDTHEDTTINNSHKHGKPRRRILNDNDDASERSRKGKSKNRERIRKTKWSFFSSPFLRQGNSDSKRPRRRKSINRVEIENGDQLGSKMRMARQIKSNPRRHSPLQQTLQKLQIPGAILSWYLLGVLSISTTKILLTDYTDCGISPLFLTVQQFVIGVSFLQCWMRMRGDTSPLRISFATCFSRKDGNEYSERYLLISAICFSLGFLLTNMSFKGSDASFVETIKAAEPLTSAAVAVRWGLEQLSPMEGSSLLGICSGVVISTLGKSGSGSAAYSLSSFSESMLSSGVVLGSNLCFSFRGLYQKLFRASPIGSSGAMDDLNLQFRMQQVGMTVFAIPLVFWDLPNVIRYIFAPSDILGEGGYMRYILLSLLNGFAFTHYK